MKPSKTSSLVAEILHKPSLVIAPCSPNQGHGLDSILAHRDALKRDLDRIEKEISFIDSAIKASMKGSVIEATDFVVMLSERKGAIDYDKVPQLIGVDLEPYRKAPIKVFQVKRRVR